MAKATTLETHVRKAASEAPAQEIADLLQGIVLLRLKQRAVARINRTLQTTQPSALGAAQFPRRSQALPSNRSRARKLPAYGKRYTATAKLDTSRFGTFRRYMISTIRAHTDTRSATATHAKCENAAFAKNRLDFNWAADNGYITWE